MKDMKIFETHSHYDDSAFDDDRHQLIKDMLGEEGILECILNVGATLDGCRASVELATMYDSVYAAVGVHPDDIEALNENEYEWLKSTALTNNKVVAIGEIGLDYYYPNPDRELQKECFRRQLRIAVEVNKPVIIHSRDACEDTLACMRAENADRTGGIIHCYSYSKEAAREYLDMGFSFGIGGVVTFKNAKKLIEAVSVIPIERIVLETDCPYMSPEPNRGKRNDSRNLYYVASKIAELKGLTYQEVVDITNANAKRLFGLQDINSRYTQDAGKR